ncbi:MAG: tsf [Candidatus Adlerbacteria bacterium]|nr:tsf [Candidatus Adlerbacteria bacterium]
MAVTAEAVKELREKTGVSIMDCKKALEEAQGDMAKAMELLQIRAAAQAEKKADRELAAGTVGSYLHNAGQVGAMAMLSCETDFVSKNEEYIALARDIAMQAAAMRPEGKDALLAQPFIKDDTKTVAELIAAASHKFGERIELSDLAVFSVH